MRLNNELVVLDLETTGVWVERDKIIEIALIKVFPDNTEERFERRVNPQMQIPSVVTELTGISDADVHNSPVFKDLAKEVIDFIGGADLAGFNLIRFDLPLLERECNEAGLEFKWQNHKVFDAQRVYHFKEKRDLTAAYKFYCGKDLENAHSAMADTEATLNIVRSQVAKYLGENSTIDGLNEFHHKPSEEYYDDERKFRWWNKKLYIMFGKYAGKYTLQELVKKDRSYLEWVLSSNFSNKIKELIENALIGNFPVPEDIQKELE